MRLATDTYPDTVRILLVSEDLPGPALGGLAKHVLTLARALVEAGHVVDLMGNGEFGVDQCVEIVARPGKFFGELLGAHAGWKERALGCFVPLRRAVTARRFARAIVRRSSGYDVVHYHGHVPDLAAFIPMHINFVQTRHDQGADCIIHTRFKNGAVCTEVDPTKCAECITQKPNAIQKWISGIAVAQYRKRVARGLRRHKTIFVSDMLRSNLARTFGNPKNEWGCVVHNFIDWSSIRKQLIVPTKVNSPVTVFVAAKLYPPKGIREFLAAIAHRLPAGMRVVIAGDGPNEIALRKQYSSDSIQLLGWCDYPKILAMTVEADVVVVPSICEEACATTVLEGLALGRMVLALNLGGTPELISYQQFPGQLQLFPDMIALVNAVLAVKPAEPQALPEQQPTDVGQRLPELLRVYTQAAREGR